MEHQAVVLAGKLWKSAVDEYFGAPSQRLASLEPEQRDRLREALTVLVQPFSGMGTFIVSRLRASVDAAELALKKKNATMNEWFEEAKRYHVHEVVRILERQRRQTSMSDAKFVKSIDVPKPRETLDTLRQVQLAPPIPDHRDTTPSMVDGTDELEGAIDGIFDDATEVTPASVVIDVEEDPKPTKH